MSAPTGPAVRLVAGPGWAQEQQARRLRHEVFVVGQSVDPVVEADDLDHDPRTTHAVLSAGGDVLATGRLVDAGDAVALGRVGRMAVAESARGRGHGARVLEALTAAARAAGLVGVELHAQAHAAGFYERAGYRASGPPYQEQGIEHVTMRREWLPGLRPVRGDEAGEVQRLIGGCFAEYAGCVLDLDDLDAWMLDPSSRPLWVVPGDGGRLDACVCVGGPELKSLYVAKAARGRGYDTALVRLAERAGARELWTDTRFEAAHRLYEALGWERQPMTRELHDPSETTEFQYLRGVTRADGDTPSESGATRPRSGSGRV